MLEITCKYNGKFQVGIDSVFECKNSPTKGITLWVDCVGCDFFESLKKIV